jgi:hypothetical protein
MDGQTQQDFTLEFDERRYFAPFNLSPRSALHFSSPAQAERFPLAHALFAAPGVVAVYLMRNFVSVIALSGVDWDQIADCVRDELHSAVPADAA